MRLKEDPGGLDPEYTEKTLICGICGMEYTYDVTKTTESECSYACATGG